MKSLTLREKISVWIMVSHRFPRRLFCEPCIFL